MPKNNLFSVRIAKVGLTPLAMATFLLRLLNSDRSYKTRRIPHIEGNAPYADKTKQSPA